MITERELIELFDKSFGRIGLNISTEFQKEVIAVAKDMKLIEYKTPIPATAKDRYERQKEQLLHAAIHDGIKSESWGAVFEDFCETCSAAIKEAEEQNNANKIEKACRDLSEKTKIIVGKGRELFPERVKMWDCVDELTLSFTEKKELEDRIASAIIEAVDKKGTIR